MITKKSRIPENPGVVDLRNGERAVRVRQTDALLQGLEVVITDRAGEKIDTYAEIRYKLLIVFLKSCKLYVAFLK